MTAIPFIAKRWAIAPAPDTPLEITDDKLVLTTNKGSGWWRTIDDDFHGGLVYGFEVDISEGIEISVEAEIEHKDQLGEHLWAHAGMERFGQAMTSVVVTDPYSDWSLHPHAGGSKRFTITYHKRKLTIFEEGLMVREVNSFGDGSETKATVGVMACSPFGGGVKATFKSFTLQEGPPLRERSDALVQSAADPQRV